jgi:hypothetical protein
MPGALDLSMDVNISGAVSFEKAIEIVETISFGPVECHFETPNGVNRYEFDTAESAALYLRALAGEHDDFREVGNQFVFQRQPEADDKRKKPYAVHTGLPGPRTVSMGDIHLHGLGLNRNRIGYIVELDLEGENREEHRLYMRNYFDMEKTFDEVDKLAVVREVIEDLGLVRQL